MHSGTALTTLAILHFGIISTRYKEHFALGSGLRGRGGGCRRGVGAGIVGYVGGEAGCLKIF